MKLKIKKFNFTQEHRSKRNQNLIYLLSLKPCWIEITISHELRIIHTDNCTLQNHINLGFDLEKIQKLSCYTIQTLLRLE